MSFVDLMASDVWSEADIVRRTESMIRSHFTADEEAILNRKATGQALGAYTLTPEDQAELALYSEVAETARQEGVAARADMALLLQILDVEAAERRLAAPVVEPEVDEAGNVTNQLAVDQDVAERAAAQSVVDAASPDVMEWVEKRRPPEPPVVEPAPEVIPEEA